jgi:hypothetical protein
MSEPILSRPPLNRSGLYNPEFSKPFVNSPNVNENTPSFNPSNTSEIKVTPMGKSPENFEASQVKSSNQELAGNSSPETQRAL